MITHDQLAILDKQLEFLDNINDDASFPHQETQHTQIRPKKYKFHKKHTLMLNPRLYKEKPGSFAGNNTLFQTRKNSSFFLLHDGNKIITNNKNLKPINYISNTEKPNFKYRISKFVWGTMKFLNLHKHVKAQKFFKCIFRQMMIKAKVLLDRKKKPQKSSKGTKTFFRFSVGSQTFYFGIGIKCAFTDCQCPITVRYKYDSVCPHHRKDYQQESMTPAPPLQTSIGPMHPHINQTRIIHSNRLGISYQKKLTYSWRHQAFFLAFSNLQFNDHRSKQQIARFARASKRPRAPHETKFLTDINQTVVRRCRHNPFLA